MTNSMTAFARESMTTDSGTLTIELRSVNHRYLDCSFKLPDILRALEPKFREQASATLARGKLDCLMRLQSPTERPVSWQIDSEQLDKLLAATNTIASRLDDSPALNPLEILQFPGICKSDDGSDEQLLQGALALFALAMEGLAENREREGEKLAAMVTTRLQQASQEVADTRQRLPELMQQQRERIVSRIQELEIDIDHNRLEQELVHQAQKADVDEELDRLEAHIGEVQRTLDKGGPCGRRLDFLMQELNREANTLSSKSFSTTTTRNAVELKVLIEQMREQIQNIE